MKDDWPTGESWTLGDSPAIGLAINPGSGAYTIKNAPIPDDGGFLLKTFDMV